MIVPIAKMPAAIASFDVNSGLVEMCVVSAGWAPETLDVSGAPGGPAGGGGARVRGARGRRGRSERVGTTVERMRERLAVGGGRSAPASGRFYRLRPPPTAHRRPL